MKEDGRDTGDGQNQKTWPSQPALNYQNGGGAFRTFNHGEVAGALVDWTGLVGLDLVSGLRQARQVYAWWFAQWFRHGFALFSSPAWPPDGPPPGAPPSTNPPRPLLPPPPAPNATQLQHPS